MTVRALAQAAFLLGAFTSSWTAVRSGGLQASDALLLVAFGLMCLDVIGTGRIPALPTWTLVGSAAITTVAVTHLLVETDANYMYTRVEVVTYFTDRSGETADSGTAAALQWLVAALVVPLIIAYLGEGRLLALRSTAYAWMLGAAASSLVAFSDFLGVTAINDLLVGYGDDTRQAGLTNQAVNVGVAAALAAPIALMVMNSRRWVGISLLTVLLSGAMVSGSRAGQAGFVLAVVLTVLLVTDIRRGAWRLVLAATAGATTLVYSNPDLVPALNNVLRIFNADERVEESNQGRRLLASQAIEDFWHRPLDGVGLSVITEAHSVPLQILASGGLLLAAGLAWYFGGALRSAWTYRRQADRLGAYLFASLCTWLLIGTVANQLTDRWLYITVGCIAALACASVGKPSQPRMNAGASKFDRSPT